MRREWLVRRAEGALDDILGRVLWIVLVAAGPGIGIVVWAGIQQASGPAIALFGIATFVFVLWGLIGLRTLRPGLAPLFRRGERQEVVALNSLQAGGLGRLEHCDVSWGGIIRDGRVWANGPYCPADQESLEYKYNETEASWRRPPAPRATPEQAPGMEALGLRPFGLPGPLNNSEGADDDVLTRDLADSDTSSDDSGPYCEKCKLLRRIPKRVGECRFEAIQAFRERFVQSC